MAGRNFTEVGKPYPTPVRKMVDGKWISLSSPTNPPTYDVRDGEGKYEGTVIADDPGDARRVFDRAGEYLKVWGEMAKRGEKPRAVITNTSVPAAIAARKHQGGWQAPRTPRT